MLAIIQCRIFCLPVCYPKCKNIQNYNFALVLYGCETWSVTLSEEFRLRVLDNGVLRETWAKEEGGNRGGEKTM